MNGRYGWIHLRDYRIKYRITLRELAAATGYCNSYLNKLETGRRRFRAELKAVYFQGLKRVIENRRRRLLEKVQASDCQPA